MRTIEEIRRDQLKRLLERHGTLVKLGSELGMTKRDSTLSQIINQSTGSRSKTPKAMGSALARRIEKTLGLEIGWMDNDPSLPPASHPHAAPTLEQALEVLGLALAADMPEDIREDLGDTLSKLARRKGLARDQLTVAHLLLSALSKQASRRA